MKSFKQFIDEKRRNPDQNPKIGILDVLDKYKTDPNVYISFVEDVGSGVRNKAVTKLSNVSGTKIGINPKSTYNTPNGIYAYPLKEAYKLYANPIDKVLNVPFAKEKPFVYIFKSKNPSKVVDLGTYNSKQYDDDYKKLSKIIIEYAGKKYKSKSFGWEIAKALLHDATNKAKNNTIGGKFWNMTRMTFRFITGYHQIINLRSEKLKQMIKNKDHKVDFSDETINMDSLDFKEKVPTSSIQWNKLFRDLGYDGVSDKQGNGIIHPAEPMQAVFFHKKAIDVLDMVMNKSYIEKNIGNKYATTGQWEEDTWENGTWEKGIWKSGKWLDGTWEKGTWMDGIWEKGIWLDGTWENGIWLDGIWKNGNWKNGTWSGGDWETGNWKNGFWIKGTWKSGKWENGTWQDGTWEKGIWQDGTWENGIWEKGFWENGTWEKGIWLDGTWEKGKIYNPKTKKVESTDVSPPEFYKLKGITT